MRLFVAETDPALGAFLKSSLEAEGYLVNLCPNSAPILSPARVTAGSQEEERHDAAILDLNTPAEESLGLLRRLRSDRPDLPILALTSRARPEDRVRVLDGGADDLIVKPFAFSELSARLRALLRRGGTAADLVLRIEDLELSRVEHTVRRAGRKIDLTPKEFALLEYLMRNAGQHVTRAEIIERVWNLSFNTMTNVVDVYINYSSSQVDKRRVGQLALAIQVAFEKMGIFDSSNTSPQLVKTEPMPFSNVQMIENAARVQSLDRIVNPTRGDLIGAREHPDMASIKQQLETALAPQIQKHLVSVTPTREGIVVSLREIGFFDSGSTALRPEAETTLGDFVKVVAPYRVRIRIEGHTDNIPIHTAKFDSNWELSTARATEIIKVFISQYAIAPQRLSASGYGEYYPMASNDTAEGRAQNRRVDLVLLNDTADTSLPLPGVSAPGNETAPAPERMTVPGR